MEAKQEIIVKMDPEFMAEVRRVRELLENINTNLGPGWVSRFPPLPDGKRRTDPC